MECPFCQRSYENFAQGDNNVIPRILTTCGHSLCHQCVTKLFNNKQIQCPLCKIINPGESVQNYIKNISLLQALVDNSQQNINSNMNEQNYKSSSVYQRQGSQSDSSDNNQQQKQNGINFLEKNHQNNTYNKSNSIIHKFQQQIYQDENNHYCIEHNKQVEAYCWTDQVPLCIDCFLIQPQQHKQHEVLNLDKSLAKQEIKLNQTQERIQQIKLKLTQSQTQLNQFKQNLEVQESLQLTKLTKFYNEIREQIDKRQKLQYVQISQSIETKREQVFSQEQHIKELINVINHGDFQLLQCQLNQQSNPLDQIIAFNNKNNQVGDILKASDEFTNQIIQDKTILNVDQFDIKCEIWNLVKIINDTCLLYGEPQLNVQTTNQSPPKKKIVVSPSKRTLNTNRSSHRDLSALNTTQSRKSLILKETQPSTTRKLTLSQIMNKDQSMTNIKSTHRQSLTNASNSNFSSRLSTLPIKPSNNVNEKQSIKPISKVTQIINQKQEKLRRSTQTPMKVITEALQTTVPITKRASIMQRNNSRTPLAKDISQPCTTKHQQTSKTQQNSNKDLTFESQLRQSLCSLIPQQNNNQKSRAILQNNNSKTQMQKINESVIIKIDECSQLNTPKIISTQLGKSPPQKSRLQMQSNNTSRLLFLKDLNKSVEESENEDNTSYCSIQKLVPDQNQTIFKKTQTTSAKRSLLYDKSLNTTMQSVTNLGLLKTNIPQTFDQDQKQSIMQRATTLKQSLNFNDSQVMRSSQFERSQTGRNSFRGPSLREKRNELKQEKRQSIIRQIESEQWLNRQTQNVESIVHARQVSSRKDKDDQINQSKLTDRQNHNFQHFTNNNNLNKKVNELNDIQKQLQSQSIRKQTDNSSGSDIQKNMIRRDMSIENYEISQFESYDPSSNVSMINLLNNQVQKHVQFRKESNQVEYLGIIQQNNEINTKQLQIECLDHYTLNVCNQIDIANFNHQIGQRVHITQDPRQSNNFLLVGGQLKNGLNNIKILEFENKLQIVEESEVFDLPESFKYSQYYQVSSGHYSTTQSNIPLLIVANMKLQYKDQDSQDFQDQNYLELLSYDFASNIWDELPPIPLSMQDICPQKDFQMTIINNSIYIMGGILNGQVTSNCIRFDLQMQEWTQICSMNIPRVQFSLCLYENSGIAVCGGYDGQAILDQCEVYDPNSNAWQMLPSLIIPRMYHSCTYNEQQQQLIAKGGVDNNEQVLNSAEVLNNDLLKWELKDIMNNCSENGTQQNKFISQKMWFNHTIIKLSL